jgi:nucleotide-binding universal stress UspA family protein
MTFARILVPLDGSRLAEAVLPAACSIAEKLDARLLLLHVLERDAPATVHGEPHLYDADEAVAYLEEHAQRLRERALAAEVHVHERPVRDVAVAVDGHAHELAADLIAMCSHGRSNLRTQLIGSIAERILHGGSVPILLRTVRHPDSATFELRKLLVPIDFGHDVDAALDAAISLARPYGADLVLLSVPEPLLPAASRFLPGTTALTRAFEGDDLRRRLSELAQRLRTEDRQVRTIVAEASPAEAILHAAESLPADLIVLVTHAHTGFSSWYEPSTGQRLLRRPNLTLLLIREP